MFSLISYTYRYSNSKLRFILFMKYFFYERKILLQTVKEFLFDKLSLV